MAHVAENREKLLTLPVAQTMLGNGNVDRWRAGLGVIYSFGS
jgi:hypothetical protein